MYIKTYRNKACVGLCELRYVWFLALISSPDEIS